MVTTAAALHLLGASMTHIALYTGCAETVPSAAESTSVGYFIGWFLSQETGWEQNNDLFCVKWDGKP